VLKYSGKAFKEEKEMRRNKVRLGVLIFLLFNILLAACANTHSAATAPPETGAPAASAAPTPAPTPEPTPTPTPTPEPEEPWREAYRAVAEQCELDFPPQGGTSDRLQYDLIDFDGDDIPELVACLDGFCVSLYTCRGGETYTLMDRWAYGAMGNAGYEYCPGKNSLRNYNSDYAGLVLYTTYLAIGPEMSMDITAEIVTNNFDDVNGNGSPDENEYESAGKYSVSYYNGEEISGEEIAAFDAGEYVYITGRWSFDELLAELEK